MHFYTRAPYSYLPLDTVLFMTNILCQLEYGIETFDDSITEGAFTVAFSVVVLFISLRIAFQGAVARQRVHRVLDCFRPAKEAPTTAIRQSGARGFNLGLQMLFSV